jgi:cytochrome c peroxidase
MQSGLPYLLFRYMKHYYKLAMACLALWLLSACSKQSPSQALREYFLGDLNIVINKNDDFLGKIRSGHHKSELQQEFLKLRLRYKQIEAFAEYFTPSTVKLVNGAPLDEIEEEENAVFEPGGLQVIEELIFTDEPVDKDELIRHTRKLQVNLKRIKMLWADIQITDSQALDALRLEIFRLTTLGISGFDTPASGNALEESKIVLEALGAYLNMYDEVLADVDLINEKIETAVTFLSAQQDFNSFDKAIFIVDHLNPIGKMLHENQKNAHIPFINDGRLLRGDVATLFEPGAFNPEALVTNPGFKSTSERVALGQKLFYDGRLSGNGNTNCGSCHNPSLAYSDGLPTSKGFVKGNIQRNAPTIMYAALQQATFYDLRSPSLEDQASDVIHNSDEMHGSLEAITKMITRDESYVSLFKKAYSDSIQPEHVQNALATFVRSLNPFSSPFDQYMRGDKKALTDGQVNGFNLFMGKAKCGTCHFVPLFNGTVPPDYQRSESEVLGVTNNADFKHPVMDSDRGRGQHNQFPQWQHAFKTSTLRNIGKTAPYMHNGAFTTLEEVMDFYNEGGGAGLGLSVPNQTLAADKLELTQQEIKDVVSFMESLSDQSF